jgi:hypothetical protein
MSQKRNDLIRKYSELNGSESIAYSNLWDIIKGGNFMVLNIYIRKLKEATHNFYPSKWIDSRIKL